MNPTPYSSEALETQIQTEAHSTEWAGCVPRCETFHWKANSDRYECGKCKAWIEIIQD